MVNLTNSLTLAIHGKSSSYISSEVGGNIHWPEIAISFAMFANKWQVWFSFVNKDGFEGKSWHVFKNAGLWFFVVRRTKLTTKQQRWDNWMIIASFLSALISLLCMWMPQSSHTWCQCSSCVTFRSEVFRNMARIDTSDPPLWVPCREFLLRQFTEYKATAAMRRWEIYRE